MIACILRQDETVSNVLSKIFEIFFQTVYMRVRIISLLRFGITWRQEALRLLNDWLTIKKSFARFVTYVAILTVFMIIAFFIDDI